MVIAAVAEGMQAAYAINNALMEADISSGNLISNNPQTAPQGRGIPQIAKIV